MAEKQSIKRFIVRDPHGHIEQEDSFSVVGEVHVDIVPGYGEPYAESEYVNGTLTITIHNIEGNGITEITTNSQEGDEAVNTVTIKTNANPEGVTLQVRNGSRGNGIASSSEVLSPEDGGTNTHTITDTDGNEHVFHTKNGQTGRKGDQGDSAVYDPSSPDAPDFVMANTTGQSTTKAMTQKAVTELTLFRQYSLIDNYYKRSNYIINSSNVWYSASSTYGGTFVKVSSGQIIKVLANSTYGTQYALLASDSIVAGQAPSWADGFTERLWLAAGEYVILEIREAKWLWVNTLINSNNTFPESIDVLDYVKNVESRTLAYKKCPISGTTINNLVIDNTNGKWVSQSNYASLLIPIDGGKTYRFTLPEGAPYFVTYSLLTDDENISAGATAHFATGFGTECSLYYSDYTYVRTPIDAKYLVYRCKINNSERLIINFEEVLPVNEGLQNISERFYDEQEINIRLQRIPVNHNTGDYGTGSYNNIFSASELFKIPADRKITFKFSAELYGPSLSYRIIGYDKEKKYISYISTSEYIEKDTSFDIDFPVGWSYFKICVGVTPLVSGQIDIVDMMMKGRFAFDFISYNVHQASADSNGNWMIPLTIGVDFPIPTSQDNESSELTDLVSVKYDHGILALPKTYTAAGTPTRLIIFCHGSAKHITAGASGFPSGSYGVDPTYWLSEGYAVMDMDGLPDDTTTPHWCAPVAYQCYLAAYKHIINNYNICKDGVFLGGRSMGGAMALTIMAFEQIPVIACCPFACMHPASIRLFYGFSSADKEMIADACGIYNPNDITWPAANNPLPLDLLKMEYATVNGHQKYIGNWGRLMQYSASYKLCVNNPSADVLTDERMFMDVTPSTKHDWQDFLTGIYGNLVIKTKTPVKFFGSYGDTTVEPFYIDLWTKMFRNGGCIVEQRMFTAGGHDFDLDPNNKLSSYTNLKGDTLENVPIAYIEALQFWRNYE